MKGKRMTADFYKFKKPIMQHTRRRKELLYNENTKNYRKPRSITLQDINLSCDFDEKTDEKT
jgi:hypothetical protein